MPDILRTGVTGLLAAQKALATTSHNIANANTEGYSRQRVEFSSVSPQSTTAGYIGQGVKVASIGRISDDFIQTRLTETTSESNRVGTYHEMITRIDTMMAEEEAGLASSQSTFFDSLQDLNTNPTSVAARQSLLNAGSNLTARYNGMQSQFAALEDETNNRISSTVSDINAIAENIAALNTTISQSVAASGDAIPSDLLDQRDHELLELSKRISVNAIPEGDGSVSVVVGNGLTIVSNERALQLSQVADPLSPEKTQIALDSGALGMRIISDQLTGGQLGGLLDFRREALDQSMNELGRLATVLADKFNEQHLQGLNLEGDRGTNFFKEPTMDAAAHTSNTGSANVGVTLTDSTALTTSDYKLKYDGAQYTLTRLSDDKVTTGAGPFNIDGIEINITGAANNGDIFLIRPTRKAAREFSMNISNIQDIAITSAIKTTTPTSNLGTGKITQPSIINADNAALTETVQISFNTPATTFNVVNTDTGTTLGANIAYVKGDDISFQGWSVQVTGEPDAGDSFKVDFNGKGTGDNRNGQLLADLQQAQLIDGTSNMLDGYGSFVSRVGSNTRQAKINDSAMAALLQESEERRESKSGVNLDEEAINLTRHQQSYQASAQVIAAADSLFNTLLNAVQG